MRQRADPRRIVRVWNETLETDRWQRVREVVKQEMLPDPWEVVKNPPMPEIVFRRGLKTYDATADGYHNVLTVSKDGYAYWSDKTLRRIVRHEMIHFLLYANGNGHESHGRIFKLCCSKIGLRNPTSHEADWKYQHVCECGWWVKHMKLIKSYRCAKCGKTMVCKAEYDRLVKIAGLNSKLHPVDISKYAVMKVVKCA